VKVSGPGAVARATCRAPGWGPETDDGGPRFVGGVMWAWLRRSLGREKSKAPGGGSGFPAPGPRPGAREAAGPGGAGLPERGRAFLRALDEPGEPLDLAVLARDDRLFLSGVMRRVREGRIDIPVLPQAAQEVSRLLSRADPPLDACVKVLDQDPALSVEVLRAANSAAYGFTGRARSVREAVIRLGLHPVRGLLIMTHLRRRVLQGGVFQPQTGWLTDLSLALSRVYRALARDLGAEPDAASTWGLLMHVEHFVLLGSLGAVSHDHGERLRPSDEALLEAFRRCGDRVRELAARAWDLEALLGFGEAGARLRAVRRALVQRWCGEPPEAVPGVAPERLETALANVAPGPGGRN